MELGPTGRRLKVWSGQEGSGQEASAGVGAALCVVDRLLAGEVDLRAPVDIMRCVVSALGRFKRWVWLSANGWYCWARPRMQVS